jgi:chorismate synthase
LPIGRMYSRWLPTGHGAFRRRYSGSAHEEEAWPERIDDTRMPPLVPLSRWTQSNMVTKWQRDEKDRVLIQSGTEFGVTLGTPIGMLVQNQDQRPKDYGGGTMDNFPRPSHADWTYLEKYGVKASSGGGRSSARETIGA